MTTADAASHLVMIAPGVGQGRRLSPPRTGRRGRPKGESAEQSVMPDAEAAVAEIQWFLTKLYHPRQKKGAIRARAIELAAEEFGLESETLRKYCKRSAGERQRLSPRPKIDLP